MDPTCAQISLMGTARVLESDEVEKVMASFGMQHPNTSWLSGVGGMVLIPEDLIIRLILIVLNSLVDMMVLQILLLMTIGSGYRLRRGMMGKNSAVQVTGKLFWVWRKTNLLIICMMHTLMHNLMVGVHMNTRERVKVTNKVKSILIAMNTVKVVTNTVVWTKSNTNTMEYTTITANTMRNTTKVRVERCGEVSVEYKPATMT